MTRKSLWTEGGESVSTRQKEVCAVRAQQKRKDRLSAPERSFINLSLCKRWKLMVYKCFPKEFYTVLYNSSNLDVEDRNLDSCCCEAVHGIHVDTTLPKVTQIYSFIICQISLFTILKTFEMQIVDFKEACICHMPTMRTTAQFGKFIN
jgi:hypothetical protein